MRKGRTSFAAAVVLAAIIGIAAIPAAPAQDVSPRPVKVGLYISPPFVMQDGDRYTGMAVELWEAVALRLGLQSDYQVLPTFGALLEATATGTVDAAVTNLTITQERAERIDFTQPWYDAGLRIMINRNANAGFRDIVAGLQKSGHIRAYTWIVLIILACTVLLTLFDRYFDREFPREWHVGLADSFYHVMSVATSGKAPHKQLFGSFGRVLAALWMVSGVAVVAYVTSSITSVMTAEALGGQINSVADLPGRAVGVFAGSVAEDYAQASRLDSRPYRNIEEAASALLNGEIAAIVGDAPVLEYFAHARPDMPFAVVGAIFEPDKYGFGLARDSEFARELTVEILGAQENEVIERLRSKYFGESP